MIPYLCQYIKYNRGAGMKNKIKNKLMKILESNHLTDTLYFINALLLAHKEVKGEMEQKGVISEQYLKIVQEFAKKHEGLQLFADKVPDFKQESFFQLCNNIQNIKADDIKETVFGVYEYLKDSSLYMGNPFNEGLINNAEFYNFIQATINFSSLSTVYDPAFGIGMGFVSILKKAGDQSP